MGPDSRPRPLVAMLQLAVGIPQQGETALAAALPAVAVAD
jgi:hypothetical protein